MKSSWRMYDPGRGKSRNSPTRHVHDVQPQNAAEPFPQVVVRTGHVRIERENPRAGPREYNVRQMRATLATIVSALAARATCSAKLSCGNLRPRNHTQLVHARCPRCCASVGQRFPAGNTACGADNPLRSHRQSSSAVSQVRDGTVLGVHGRRVRSDHVLHHVGHIRPRRVPPTCIRNCAEACEPAARETACARLGNAGPACDDPSELGPPAARSGPPPSRAAIPRSGNGSNLSCRTAGPEHGTERGPVLMPAQQRSRAVVIDRNKTRVFFYLHLHSRLK